MKFRLRDGFKFEVGNIKGVAITSKDNIRSGNVAYLDLNGKHGKTKTTLSDRFYFVLEGSGKFVIDDKTIEVEKDDVVIVPKNTIYDFQGKMKLILFSTPAFDPEYETYYEK